MFKRHIPVASAFLVLFGLANTSHADGPGEPSREVGSAKIFQVDSVVIHSPRKPGVLTLCVEGTARTAGFTNTRLERATPSMPADGVYEFNLVGDAPAGPVAQVLTTIAVRYTWQDFPADLKGVRVVAETNASIARVGENERSCLPQSADEQSHGSTPTLIGGSWLAEDIRGGGVIDRARSTISFDPSGAVSGSGGCNRFRGTAKVEGKSLRFAPLASTRKWCAPALMDQEQKFFSALEATREFRFEGTFLKFYDATGVVLIRFTRLG